MATLLTQREAASVLRLSERTLERWRVSGPTRAATNIHNSRNQQYGDGHPGEGSITGAKRGVV
jgi:hypothetical protein